MLREENQIPRDSLRIPQTRLGTDGIEARALGTSVYAQVQRIRFERVIELMTDPAMSLDEIAYSTGFGASAAFSTMFRRHFKQAPSAYRAGLLRERHTPPLRAASEPPRPTSS